MINIKRSLLSLFSLVAIVVLGLYISTGSSALLRAEDAPAVTNLTGYSWVGQDYGLDVLVFASKTFNLNFTTLDNVSYSQIAPSSRSGYVGFKYDSLHVYDTDSYWGTYWQTKIGFTITGGADVTDPTVIAWFENPTNGTLTAPAGYEVTFVTNGGTAVDALVDVIEDSKITVPVAPTKENHTFVGWYKEETLNNIWDFDVDTVTSNITLYAKWEEDEDTTAPVFDSANPINTTVSYKTILDLNVWKETLIITDNVDDYVERTIYQDNYTANKAVPGTYVITVRAIDTAGNIKDKNYNIIVVDDIKPVFNGPESIYKPQSSSMTIQDILNRYTAFDEISGNVTSRIYVHQDNYTGRGHIANTYTVILRVSDLANNVEYFTIYITVTDDIPPVIYVADGYFIQVSTAYTLTIEGIRDILIATGRLNIVSATTWSVLVNEYQGNENTPGIYTVSIRFQQTSGVTEVHSVAIDVKNASSTPGGIMQPESSNGYIYIGAGIAIIGLIIILKKRK